MSDIAERVAQVRARVDAAAVRAGRDPAQVRIVAVTKRHPARAVEEAYAAGMRAVGENFAQEMVAKRAEARVGEELEWHFIGRLQRNKVKALVGHVDLVHAVDSARLAEEIDKRTVTPLRVLIAVNVAGEDSKSGVAPADLGGLLEAIGKLPRVTVVGLMTMPPLAARPEDNRVHFRALRALRDQCASAQTPLPELSMGTTSDYEVAVEEGATLVRVGTAIFGARG